MRVRPHVRRKHGEHILVGEKYENYIKQNLGNEIFSMNRRAHG